MCNPTRFRDFRASGATVVGAWGRRPDHVKVTFRQGPIVPLEDVLLDCGRACDIEARDVRVGGKHLADAAVPAKSSSTLNLAI